jgi:hypothetical protein
MAWLVCLGRVGNHMNVPFPTLPEDAGRNRACGGTVRLATFHGHSDIVEGL